MLRRWGFRLVPSERSLEAVGESVRLHIISRSKAFDLFPRTYKGKNRCVLRQKYALINSRERTLKSDINLEQSSHVETVAVLSRKSATKTFIPVTVSPKDMGLDEAKAQPTYENIRKYVKETHGLTVSTLNIAQMKAECGLEMECDRSGGKQQPKCPS